MLRASLVLVLQALSLQHDVLNGFGLRLQMQPSSPTGPRLNVNGSGGVQSGAMWSPDGKTPAAEAGVTRTAPPAGRVFVSPQQLEGNGRRKTRGPRGRGQRRSRSIGMSAIPENSEFPPVANLDSDHAMLQRPREDPPAQMSMEMEQRCLSCSSNSRCRECLCSEHTASGAFCGGGAVAFAAGTIPGSCCGCGALAPFLGPYQTAAFAAGVGFAGIGCARMTYLSDRRGET
ncbi:unnamed protein product [Amoebophrya sp. A120]|nr:unnamed protein product [Amoebophrya sp. A120]|eukprot:GSA120T00001459001.1